VHSLPLPSLGDDVVALRAFRPDDATAVFEACQDPLIVRFTTFPTAESPDGVRMWIAGHRNLRQRGEALDLAIVPRSDKRLLGAVGIGDWHPEHRRAAAGYWLAPWARGQGIAARALSMLSGWALAPPLSVTRLELHIDAENCLSQRTAERAGFAREGILRSYLHAKDRSWDVTMYARLAETTQSSSRQRSP